MREILKSRYFILFLSLLLVFALYSLCLIIFMPHITAIDIKSILLIKHLFEFLPLRVVVSITDFGFSSYFIPFLIPLFVICLYLKKYRTFTIITVGYFFLLPIIQFIKNVVMRQRPDVYLQRIAETEFSYPSGHTTTAFFMGIIFLFLINTYIKSKILKNSLLVIVIAWMLIIPFTRVWLGVHYPTDTIGGAFLGASFAFLLLCIISHIEIKS